MGRVFTGLDPNKRYRYTASAVRAGGYVDRWIKITLFDAVSFTTGHTAGCLTNGTPGVTIAANEVALSSGDNTAGDAILKLVGGPAIVERRMRALGFNAINVNRYEGQIAFEMNGVMPPPESEWTLEVQRRLADEVSPAALRAGRARYTHDDPRDPRNRNRPQ